MIAGTLNGFTLKGTTYTSLSYPGAFMSTTAAGIDNGGTIVGQYEDAGDVGGRLLSLSGSSYTFLSYPGASSTFAAGINDEGTIVGYYADASGVEHGFSLSGSTYTSLSYPGASSTFATGINDGTIVGYYADASGVEHGFLAIPQGIVAWDRSLFSAAMPGLTATTRPEGSYISQIRVGGRAGSKRERANMLGRRGTTLSGDAVIYGNASATGSFITSGHAGVQNASPNKPTWYATYL